MIYVCVRYPVQGHWLSLRQQYCRRQCPLGIDWMCSPQHLHTTLTFYSAFLFIASCLSLWNVSLWNVLQFYHFIVLFLFFCLYQSIVFWKIRSTYQCFLNSRNTFFSDKVTVWLSNNVLVKVNVSCSTSSWVSTEMGDRLQAGIPTWYFAKSTRPTQPGHPSVFRCIEYWRWSRPSIGKKQRVLRRCRPGV